MNFSIFVFVVVQYFYMSAVNAYYNEDITCAIDQGQEPVCRMVERMRSKSNTNINKIYHDYIPRNNAYLFNCSTECLLVKFTSMTELTSPSLFLKSCFTERSKYDTYKCETIRYNNFKNIDKLLFLSKIIPNKSFYMIDCFINSVGKQICHKKDAHSHSKLVSTGDRVRLDKLSLIHDEFICEEDKTKKVKCDNSYMPLQDRPTTTTTKQESTTGSDNTTNKAQAILSFQAIRYNKTHRNFEKIYYEIPSSYTLKKNCTGGRCRYVLRFNATTTTKLPYEVWYDLFCKGKDACPPMPPNFQPPGLQDPTVTMPQTPEMPTDWQKPTFTTPDASVLSSQGAFSDMTTPTMPDYPPVDGVPTMPDPPTMPELPTTPEIPPWNPWG